MGGFPAVEIFKNDKAPWVLFIHAIGGGAGTWALQTEAFAADYNLLLAEFHAETHTERRDEPLEIENVCKRLFEMLNERGIERVHIVSLCGGSLIALAFAALYPNMVGGMVSAGGILAFNTQEKIGYMFLQFMKITLPYMLAYRIIVWMLMPGKRHLKARRAIVDGARSLDDKFDRAEFGRWVDFIAVTLDNDSYIERLNSLKNAPRTLYVMGSGDKRWLPLLCKHIHRLNNARIEVLPGCGHVCFLDRPDLFNEIALNFIGAQEMNQKL